MKDPKAPPHHKPKGRPLLEAMARAVLDDPAGYTEAQRLRVADALYNRPAELARVLRELRAEKGATSDARRLLHRRTAPPRDSQQLAPPAPPAPRWWQRWPRIRQGPRETKQKPRRRP